MKFLRQFWPWKEIARLQALADRIPEPRIITRAVSVPDEAALMAKDRELSAAISKHQFEIGSKEAALALAKELLAQSETQRISLERQVVQLTERLSAAKQKIQDQADAHAVKDDHMRKLGKILAMSKGIAVAFMLFCLSANGQIWRNSATTNQLPIAVGVSGGSGPSTNILRDINGIPYLWSYGTDQTLVISNTATGKFIVFDIGGQAGGLFQGTVSASGITNTSVLSQHILGTDANGNMVAGNLKQYGYFEYFGELGLTVSGWDGLHNAISGGTYSEYGSVDSLSQGVMGAIYMRTGTGGTGSSENDGWAFASETGVSVTNEWRVAFNTLPSTAQPAWHRFGYFAAVADITAGTATPAESASGVYLRIGTNNAGGVAALLFTSNASSTTITDTGFGNTFALSTWYVIQLVLEGDGKAICRIGSTANNLTLASVTNTVNVPSSQWMFTGSGITKVAGTGNSGQIEDTFYYGYGPAGSTGR